jgi:hypothetical protein
MGRAVLGTGRSTPLSPDPRAVWECFGIIGQVVVSSPPAPNAATQHPSIGLARLLDRTQRSGRGPQRPHLSRGEPVLVVLVGMGRGRLVRCGQGAHAGSEQRGHWPGSPAWRPRRRAAHRGHARHRRCRGLEQESVRGRPAAEVIHAHHVACALWGCLATRLRLAALVRRSRQVKAR